MSSDRHPLDHPLFADGAIRTPLEELDALFEKRVRGLEVSASHDQLDRLKRAHEIARRCLESAMESGGGLPGTARARWEPAATGEANGGEAGGDREDGDREDTGSRTAGEDG